MSDLGEIYFENLVPAHAVGGFVCEKAQFTSFLQNDALRDSITGLSQTVVAVRETDRAILGYHTLCNTSIARQGLPASESNLPQYARYPGILLAQLAVHQSVARRGLGKRLLVNAMRDALEARRFSAWRFFMLDAYDEEALQYWQSRELGFAQVPGQKKLFMPIEQVRAAVES